MAPAAAPARPAQAPQTAAAPAPLPLPPVPAPAVAAPPPVTPKPVAAAAPAAAPPSAPATAATLAAPQPGAGKIPVLDLDTFNTCRETVRQFDQLLNFYLSDSETYLKEIGDHLAVGDVEPTVMPSHTLKSSSQLVGAMGLHELAKSFEARARSGGGELANLRKLHQHMLRVFAATRQALEQAMAQKSQAA